MNKFTGLVRRCIEDYHMIDEGETVAVGVSGGKDSVALLCALANLRSYYPKRFRLHAVTLSMGFEGMDFTPIADLCRTLDVPYTLRTSELGKLIFEERREKNPCALCAKMRRGALHGICSELGIRKIALAHHYDDAVETFLLSLFYEGRLSCFQPVTYMSRTGVTQIRPMLYAGEGTVRGLVRKHSLPVVENACPENGRSKREEVKTLLKTLSAQYPDLKSKIFGAMQRLPLDGGARGITGPASVKRLPHRSAPIRRCAPVSRGEASLKIRNACKCGAPPCVCRHFCDKQQYGYGIDTSRIAHKFTAVKY